MLDKAILEFLEDKKKAFVKKNMKESMDEQDRIDILAAAKEKFSLESWLVDSSCRASQLFLTSHPAKFTHPNAKVSNISADATGEHDGLLRSGNVKVGLDAFGNAAALDVEKFLRTKLSDGASILSHIEGDTPYIQEQFKVEGLEYKLIRKGFLNIKCSDVSQTSEKIKQVYFPVDEEYHLLSILNSSVLIYKLKERINRVQFSESNNSLRDELKKSSPSPVVGVIENVLGLTGVGYGGTQPQNISTLNSKNGGVSLVLPCIPPFLEKRDIQPPKKDFFEDCLWGGLFKYDLKAFHKALVSRKNNINIRGERDEAVLSALARMQRLVMSVRDITAGWSDCQRYDGLPLWQKVWLDEKNALIRCDKNKNHGYISEVQRSFAYWFIGQYKSSTEDSVLLGNDDIEHVKQLLVSEEGIL